MPAIKYLSLGLLALCLTITGSLAQTPQDPAFAGTRVTFTLDDVLGSMTDAERTEFQELRLKMRKNKTSQGQLADDPDSVALLQAGFDRLKEEFEQKFSAFRGVRGQSVMVYGNPLPSKAEVLSQVMFARVSGSGDSMLYPHWSRERASGAVLGGTAKPVYESGPPAGDTVSARVGYDGGQTRPSTTDRDWSCEATAGPVRDDWNYEVSGEPKCICSAPEELVFGIPSCWWYSDRN